MLPFLIQGLDAAVAADAAAAAATAVAAATPVDDAACFDDANDAFFVVVSRVARHASAHISWHLLPDLTFLLLPQRALRKSSVGIC